MYILFTLFYKYLFIFTVHLIIVYIDICAYKVLNYYYDYHCRERLSVFAPRKDTFSYHSTEIMV